MHDSQEAHLCEEFQPNTVDFLRSYYFRIDAAVFTVDATPGTHVLLNKCKKMKENSVKNSYL